MDIRKITEELSVAPQVTASDIAAVAAAGFRSVICNRPDGESADQPCCGDIEAVVKAHGLVWRSQPVRSGAVTMLRIIGAIIESIMPISIPIPCIWPLSVIPPGCCAARGRAHRAVAAKRQDTVRIIVRLRSSWGPERYPRARRACRNPRRPCRNLSYGTL